MIQKMWACKFYQFTSTHILKKKLLVNFIGFWPAKQNYVNYVNSIISIS